MNADNLNRVADAIENHEIAWLGFNMWEWADDGGDVPDMSGHKCGTTACVAGWAAAVRHDLACSTELLGLESIAAQAREYFELSISQADALFMGHPHARGGRGLTEAKDAVRVLRHAAKHGVIDWDAAQA